VRGLFLVILLVWPLLPSVPYDLLNTAILTCQYLIVALSLVLLIGLVGQISLFQASLVGMGAFMSAIATHHAHFHFPFTLLVGIVAGAGTATIIGAVALRVRGLYLAVATLIFAYVCDQYLFAQTWLVENQSGTSIPSEGIGRAGTIPYLNLADAHVFYYMALAVAMIALYVVANLRDSRTGRGFAAIRGSEVAAASLGIDVMRYKLIGFACAGALAGLAGSLTLAAARTVEPTQFNILASLDFLAIAVVGGLRSMGGAIASSLMFALLVGEVFYHSPTLSNYLDLISALLLITVLLFFRGGLGAVPERLRAFGQRMRPHVAGLLNTLRKPAEEDGDVGDAAIEPGDPLPVRLQRALAPVLRLVPRRAVAAEAVAGGPPSGAIDVVALRRKLRGTKEPAPVTPLPVQRDQASSDPESAAEMLRRAGDFGDAIAGHEGPDGRRHPALLEAESITVRFGGLTAVNDAGIRVGAGEIVGLIGPNGAGKTTLFNSLLGLNSPAAGAVRLFGKDVTSWDVHERAALGVGRTFQVLQLFGDLTVFENLMVATHLHNRTGFWGSLVVSSGARRAERAARERVRAVLEMMDLERFADRRVGDLPFGVLRLIEVSRTLVTGAPLVCFDEPASGLDSAETERLIDWFRFLRQIGVTLLVIEHDVSMMVRLCDYIYVLDQGRLIASGTPAQIQRDPAVIASYLGTTLEAAS
jgi:ABC-type branched-subunit amino acid transport system ATPase component/ABC-type branched-subunit amino acid transport system permease subunit